MTVLSLYVESPPAFKEKDLLNITGVAIEKYEISKKGGGGINIWLSLDELERLKQDVDIVYKATRDLRNK